jgi:hypothetical protein
MNKLDWAIVALLIAVAFSGVFFLCMSSSEDTSANKNSQEQLANKWSTDMGYKPEKISCIYFGGGHSECTIKSEDKLFAVACYLYSNTCILKASVK